MKTPGCTDPLMFAGLIGAAIANGSNEIWYSDGSPKTEADLMRVPWIARHIRREYAERWEWRNSHCIPAQITPSKAQGREVRESTRPTGPG